MRKYYLFIVKEKYKNQNVFNTLNNLYNIRENNLLYGVKLFHEICELFDKKVISSYLEVRFKTIKKIKKNQYYLNGYQEQDLIVLKKSAVIIITNLNFPLILRTFNIYNRNIFVCDFENRDYFWLDNMVLNHK